MLQFAGETNYMRYLRLAEGNSEFQNNGRPVVFLGDIKELNITVGPNNSRKSRFLHLLINQDFKVILDGEDGLNEAFLTSKKIFDTVEPKFMDSGYSLMQLQVLESRNTYNRILAKFLNDRVGHSTEISFTNLEVGIEKINKTLTSSNSLNDFNELKILCETYNLLVNNMMIVYRMLVKNKGLVQKPNNYMGFGIENVTYYIKTDDRNKVEGCEEKLSVLCALSEYINKIKHLKWEGVFEENIYIPVLRTSRMLEGISGDVFEATLRSQHFKDKGTNLSLETGLSLYEKIGFATNGTQQKKREFREFEKFIGTVFFQSEDLYITAYRDPKNSSKHIKVSIPGEMEDRDIHNLGDGIQAIINLLFPIFTSKEKSWIFIDEPENHLHPGFQAIFIRALSENDFIKSKQHTIFINTHSNHILSEALLALKETEIFVFSKSDKTASNILTFTGNEYSALELLGVLNASVLISNCSIWVEGVTDRLYLKGFLNAYLRSLESGFKPVEGLNYTYLEYAGINHLHYDFDPKSVEEGGISEKIDAFLINTNIFLLADTDSNEHKHQTYRAIERSNFTFRETLVPEIENLLPEKMVRDFLIEELKFPIREIDNISPLQSDGQKLGTFLSHKLNGLTRQLKLEADYGGTLAARYKKKLADFVYRKLILGIYTMIDIHESPELEKLIIELYNFISLKNRKY